MKNLLKKTVLILWFFPSLTFSAPTDPIMPIEDKYVLEAGFINQDRYPYFVNSPKQSSGRGIYIDFLNKIGDLTNIEFKYKFLPQPRIRHLMKYQKLDVEPGIDENWRMEELEVENSVYTIPFYTSEEVIVYRKSSLDIPASKESDFENLFLCSMSGFNDINASKEDINITGESALIDMMELGRCDYILIPKLILNEKGKLSDSLAVTPTIKTYSLRIRLSKKNEHLVSKMDKAITTLTDEGYVEALFASYIQDGK